MAEQVPRKCLIKNCTPNQGGAFRVGYCNKHYRRIMKFGDPHYTMRRYSSHGMAYHPLYSTWEGMIQRCTNPNFKEYHNYGGRGIKVCDRWRDSFPDFYSDMGDRPSSKHTLNRIDNDGNYEPGNVRWDTYQVQSRNKRPMKSRTGITGVDLVPNRRKPWRARLKVGGTTVLEKQYFSMDSAIKARKRAEKMFWGVG